VSDVYRPEIDLALIDAIDTHVHIEVSNDGHAALPDAILEASARYFKTTPAKPRLADVAAHYRERRTAAVVFTVDASTTLGHAPVSSTEIIAEAADHADILIPFGSVDPLQGRAAVDLAYELARDHGAQGFKLHPTVQGFDPSDDAIRPLWAAFAELGLPVVVHTGQTGIGAGTPAAFGFKLRYSNPMLLDDVLADFPDLTLVLAHPSVPWADEQISVATHKTNAWIDLSGWSPKYFPPQLVRAANSFLQDRVLFGSDYPLLTPERWLRDFAELELKDEARAKITKANAVRLLGLGGEAA
jgi:predicted TIM-barrel fold metal-dependent hydrolase